MLNIYHYKRPYRKPAKLNRRQRVQRRIKGLKSVGIRSMSLYMRSIGLSFKLTNDDHSFL